MSRRVPEKASVTRPLIIRGPAQAPLPQNGFAVASSAGNTV
jgi:hypothetical protein